MTASERRLLLLSSVLVAGFISIIGVKKFREWGRKLDAREHSAGLQMIEAEVLMEQAAEWKQREAWIAGQQPQFQSESETTQEFLDYVVKQAAAAGVTITNKQYNAPLTSEWHTQFGVDVTVKGKLPQVFRMVHSMQSPASFRVIPYLKVTPDRDDVESVICSMKCWRWYQPRSTARSTL